MQTLSPTECSATVDCAMGTAVQCAQQKVVATETMSARCLLQNVCTDASQQRLHNHHLPLVSRRTTCYRSESPLRLTSDCLAILSGMYSVTRVRVPAHARPCQQHAHLLRNQCSKLQLLHARQCRVVIVMCFCSSLLVIATVRLHCFV